MHRRIKILFTIPNFITAGSGREMCNIIERLDKGVFDVTICVAQPGGGVYEELIAAGYTIIEGDFKRAGSVWNRIRFARRLASLYKPYGFDIWQSFHWSSDYTEALVARFAGIRYVYVKKNMNWDRMAWRVKSYLADAIVARNTTMRDTYFSHPVFRHKTVYIPGAVDTKRYTRTGDNSLRQESDIPKDAYLVSCVAQLVRVKDQATAIRAISGLENVWLILAGATRDEAYAAELKSLADNLQVSNRVVFTQVHDAVQLLDSSDAFVLPTSSIGGHEEGCPVALLEAMSMQLPCVASNVAGNRDLVRHEQTGLLFQPGDDKALAECLSRYMREPDFAKTCAENASREVKALHTLETEAKRFAELYKKLAHTS